MNRIVLRVMAGLAVWAALIGASIGGSLVLAAPSSGSTADSPPETSADLDASLEEQLKKTYAEGLRFKERAWKAEEKAALATTEKNKQRQLKRAQKDYNRAQDEFAEVLRENPKDYNAANELGYVLRKQGEYEQAIGAYNYALQLFPEFDQAIEYRAEAFVAIGYYDEAKKAYMHLFRTNSELAEGLMMSMRKWRDDLDSGPQGPSARTRSFLEWLEAREKMSTFGETTESSSSGW